MKAWDSYDLAKKFTPNWGRGRAKHNHDESEDQTIGSKKTQEDTPQKCTIYQFKENSLTLIPTQRKKPKKPCTCLLLVSIKVLTS